ncbi:MAG: FMN-binding protein [Spirochaetia bacterium]|jgi:major membrane immunogen (membrane-anchored lipoprotein)
MKGRVHILLAMAVVVGGFALAACSGKTGQMRDGTYLATYAQADAYGWHEFLQISVKGGKIASAKFDAISPERKLKTNDQQYSALMKKISGTAPQQYAKKLEEALVQKQITPIDAVSGATESSKSFNQLADRLVAPAKVGNTSPVIIAQNATYTAEGKPDEDGWIPHLEVTFDNGQISKVYFEDVKKKGDAVVARQTDDTAYQKEYRKATKNTLIEVLTKLETSLQQSGDPSKVATVSGASEYSDNFRTLAKDIIHKQRVSISPQDIQAVLRP